VRTRLLALLLAAAAAPHAAAQSFNVDFGDAAQGPPPTYAAAGLAGRWNSIPLPHTTSNPGPVPQDVHLVDLDGNPTNVGLHQYGGTELLAVDDPTISGDDALLLEDGLVTHSIAVKTCLYFNGLENGTYEVLTYAWMPAHPEVIARSFFDNTPGNYLSGGAWGGSHQLGLTYVRHIVQVTNGFIGPHSGLQDTGDPVVGAMINGMQLRKISCVGCTSYCFGDGSGTACPCGNAGVAGRGCDNSFGTDGGRLTASGTPSVSADDVLLVASDLPPSTTVLFFQGTQRQASGFGTVFGDGLLCASGTVLRLGGRVTTGGTASYGAGDGTPALVSVHGMLPAGGGLRAYQGWYRNQAPMFCTPDRFNLTNGIEIPWAP
jgi:hypothetical protein